MSTAGGSAAIGPGTDNPFALAERDRIQSAWLGDVLSSPDPQVALDPARTRFLSIDTSKPLQVLVLRPDDSGRGAPPAEMWAALRGSAPGRAEFVVTTWEELLVLVQPLQDMTAAGERVQAERTLDRLRPVLGARVRAGIGRVAQTGQDVPSSLAEAVQALEAPAGDPVRPLVHIADVHIFGLLSLIRDQAALASFVDSNIGMLRNEPDLLATLVVLLDCNFAVAAAARKMHVHYNTMRYRLDKLVSLLGPLEQDPQRLLGIQLALHIQKMLPG